MRLQDLAPGDVETLPQVGPWPEVGHYFDEDHLIAAVASWHANRPLLIVGEPGIGKSQLARAIAHKTGMGFLPVVIRPGFQYQDLLWEFDSVSRLGQAQMMAIAGVADEDNPLAALDKNKFLVPGPLWWAYRPVSATNCGDHRGQNPVYGSTAGKGVVLLIDEIDKADSDLPNGLLDVLSNADISIPVEDDSSEEARRVLTIITSNGDRQLPPAFVRRCLVLKIEMPDTESALKDYLLKVCDSRRTQDDCDLNLSQVDTTVIDECIRLFSQARKQTPVGERKPSLAEFLDLLRIACGMGGEKDQMLDTVARLHNLTFKKHL